MKYYDYSRGLKAPYSMQVIKSPKGQVVWVFAQPVSLSYLLILFLGIVLTGLFWKEVPLPQILGINLNLLIMVLDSRPIVAFERVKEIEEFSFKR